MDEALIEKKRASPVEPDLRKIAALERLSDLPAFVAELQTLGVNAFFTFGAGSDFKDAKTVMAVLDQGGLGLPDRGYYFRADANSADVRGQYTDHVAKLASMAVTGASAAARSWAIWPRLQAGRRRRQAFSCRPNAPMVRTDSCRAW